MKGARKLPQLNFRWPEKDIALAKKWAEKNGRSLNSEVHRIVMEFISREESREAKA
ncbi:Arc family DNA-binding protein [Providencia huaxiensis]|uniref:Arc family DNA-binding protein n=1 Tax=Providencia huaxiensis TaxID=2027290 RepID=UPI0032DB696D